MNWIRRANFADLSPFLIGVALIIVVVLATGCSNNPNDPNNTASGLKGTLYMNSNAETIYSLDLETGTAINLFAGSDPFRTAEGTFIVRTLLGLEEVSANGITSRVIVREHVQAPFEVTYDNSFRNPQVSPDGKYIAYDGQYNSPLDIYIVDRVTGDLLASMKEPEPTRGYARPSWTPDNRIVVAGNTGNPGIYITDAGWNTLTRIDDNITFPSQPQVSPDGTMIALIVNDHVYTMKIDGTELTQLTTSSSQESWPTWSPDGKHIAFYANDSILVINIATGTVIDVKSISATADNFIETTARKVRQFYWLQ